MKMPDIIEETMFATCGMNCIACYKHIAARNYGKPCRGCFDEPQGISFDSGKLTVCHECDIKNCAKEKKLKYCYECKDFPCKILARMENSYNERYDESIIENSITVKEHGIEKFMESQREKWICPKCGGIISIHDFYCSECGSGFVKE